MNRSHCQILVVLLISLISCPIWAQEETITWGDCVKESAKNHPDLISAQEAVKQSQAVKRIDLSPMLPQISADLSANYSKTTGGTSTTAKSGNSYAFGVNGSQLIFNGLKDINSVKAASQNVKAAQYNYRFTSSDVRQRLRTAFIDLLSTQELLNIAEDIRKIRQDNLDLINLRYKSGTEHRGALLTAQANLAQAEFDIAQAKRALEVSQRQLLKEMGRAQFSPVIVKGEFKVANTASEKPDFEALAKANPTLGKLNAQKNAASYGVNSAWGNFSPELSVQGGYNRVGPDWAPNSNQWSAGISLSLPLFQGGLRLAELDQAKAQYHQALQNERSAKDGIVVTLEQTWASLQDAASSVDVQYKFLIAADERAKIAQEQYSLGLLTYDNWTIIEDTLVSAKRSYLNSQTNALLAEANWIKAKGETLDHAD